jgi:hypothetical protein
LIVSNHTIYRALYGTILLDRWKTLIEMEIKQIESELSDQLPKINCNPPPLFHKRATKFDGLLAAGVSYELHSLTQKFFNRLSALMLRVEKYVQIGYEENVEVLRTHLAGAIMKMLKRFVCLIKVFNSFDSRLTKQSNENTVKLLPSEENQRWLKDFRLYLALVQYEPSVISQCMFDNTEKAVEANQMLRAAAENALWLGSFCFSFNWIVLAT